MKEFKIILIIVVSVIYSNVFATHNRAGEITYTPSTGYFGNDSYTYAICDFGTPTVTCDTAVVTITVNLNWGINEADANLIQVCLNRTNE